MEKSDVGDDDDEDDENLVVLLQKAAEVRNAPHAQCARSSVCACVCAPPPPLRPPRPPLAATCSLVSSIAAATAGHPSSGSDRLLNLFKSPIISE